MADYILSAKITGDSSKFSQAFKDAEGKIQSFNSKMTSAGGAMMKTGTKITAATAPLALFGAKAIKTGMEFDSSMSQVASTMGITKEEIAKGSKSFEALEAAAREMGKTTQFSASESAEALNYLALAGYDTEQSIATLPKVLTLASAGGMDLAYTSDLITDSAGALGLEIKDLDGFIDQMAKTSQKSNTDVSQLGEAILTVGANGRGLKGGTVELTTAIGLLGNVGIKGSEAGTKLRNVIMAMTPTTKAATAAFETLGVETYDAQGELRGLDEIFSDLNVSMKDMTSEEKKRMMTAIFNKQDMAAALTLLASTSDGVDNIGFALEELGVPVEALGIELDALAGAMLETGSESEFTSRAMEEFGLTAEQSKVAYDLLQQAFGDNTAWNELEGHIKESDGAAQDMSDTLTDNLEGSVKEMGSAFEELQISLYKTSSGAMRDVIDKVTELINKFSGMSAETQGIIVVVGALLVALGPIVMVLGALVTAIGMIATPVGAAVIAFASLIAIGVLLYQNWDTIKEKASAVFGNFAPLLEPFKAAFQSMKSSVEPVIESLKGLWESLKPVFAAVAAIIGSVVVTAFGVMVGALSGAASAIQPLINMFINLVDFISSGVATIVQIFNGDFAGAWQSLQDMGGQTIDFIVNGFKGLLNFVGGFVKGIVDFFHGMYMTIVGGSIVPDMVNGITKWFTNMVTWVTDLTKSVVDGVVQGFNAMKTGITTIVNAIKTVITTVWNAIKTTISTIMGAISNTISTVWNSIKTIVTTVVNGVKSAVTTGFNAIKTVISTVMSSISTTISSIWNLISGVVSTVVNSIKTTISTIFNSMAGIVTTAMSSVKEAVSTGITGAYNAVLNKVSDFKNAGTKIVTSIADGIRGAMSKVTDAIGSVVSNIRDRLPFSPAKVGPLSDLDRLNFGGPISDSLDRAMPDVQARLDTLLTLPDTQKSSNARQTYGSTSNDTIYGDISVTIDAKDLKEMNNISDFFNRIEQVSVQGVR